MGWTAFYNGLGYKPGIRARLDEGNRGNPPADPPVQATGLLYFFQSWMFRTTQHITDTPMSAGIDNQWKIPFDDGSGNFGGGMGKKVPQVYESGSIHVNPKTGELVIP
jgi:hypothetical protein